MYTLDQMESAIMLGKARAREWFDKYKAKMDKPLVQAFAAQLYARMTEEELQMFERVDPDNFKVFMSLARGE